LIGFKSQAFLVIIGNCSEIYNKYNSLQIIISEIINAFFWTDENNIFFIFHDIKWDRRMKKGMDFEKSIA
jgi:hypothetical protein